jgi:hypothetical protein
MVSAVMIDSLLGGAECSTEAFERTVVGFFLSATRPPCYSSSKAPLKAFPSDRSKRVPTRG